MRTKAFIGVIFLLVYFSLHSVIEVKRDKNGRISISNMHSTHTPYKSASKNQKSVAKFSVPSIYLSKIKKFSQKHNVKESLVLAVTRAESGFNPFAVSRKGAVGLMQLMPETARRYGVWDRYNVDQNLEAGIKHLKYLLKRYNKNIPLTLAAYNAGEEAVKEYNGVPPYRETRTYIKRVMKFMGLGYSNFFNVKVKKKIYKIVSDDGRITITDKLPSKVKGRVTVFE
jgi:soluble lytic murein transglycosylase-like protein